MFSLPKGQRPVAIYAEWVVFSILIVVLIALWWLIEFGLPGGLFSHQQKPYTVPQQVIDNLIGSRSQNLSPEVPSVIVKTLSTAPSQSGTASTTSSKGGVPAATPATPSSVTQLLSASEIH